VGTVRQLKHAAELTLGRGDPDGYGLREFTLVDDGGVQVDRMPAEALTALLGPVAIRVEPCPSTLPGEGAERVGLMVTVDNVDNETRYLPRLEAAGWVLRLRVPGHRIFTLPAHDVELHLRDDDDPDAATAH